MATLLVQQLITAGVCEQGAGSEHRAHCSGSKKNPWAMQASFYNGDYRWAQAGASKRAAGSLQLKPKREECGRKRGMAICAAYNSSSSSSSRADYLEAYHTLGLQPSATRAEIKQAYRRLALKLHPDTCKEGGEEGAARFIRATNAYNALLDQLAEHADNQYYAPYPYAGYGSNAEEEAVQYEEEAYPRNHMQDSDEWEEWMGYEGANGTYDYSSHIRQPAY
ncbi:hypothetical protein L7F22_035305 [Adiantum nelumboides]|nr:hypothetical protein [Adiantum nelumboides]